MEPVIADRIDPGRGRLRRTRPLCDKFGFSRGNPIDRHYIEAFLAAHCQDIRGRVLEVGDATYTRKFGGPRATRSDVLRHPSAAGPAAFVGDLASGAGLPDATFDCAILTQTIDCIYDCRAALRHVFRALRAGGVLLLTTGCLGHVSRYDMQRWGDYWRFTPAAVGRMLGELSAVERLEVITYGSAVSAAAFLYGLAAHELARAELDRHEPACPVLVAARVAKRPGEPGTTPPPRPPDGSDPLECEVVATRAGAIEQLYTEQFLGQQRRALRGRTLRLSDAAGLRQACGQAGDGPFDCIVCLHELAGVYDPRATIESLYHLLRPGGVLLATLPGICPVRAVHDYWRFTSLSASRLFGEVFPPENVTVETFGNVLTAAAMLLDRGPAELTAEELCHRDPDYQLLLGVRATVPGSHV